MMIRLRSARDGTEKVHPVPEGGKKTNLQELPNMQFLNQRSFMMHMYKVKPSKNRAVLTHKPVVSLEPAQQFTTK